MTRISFLSTAHIHAQAWIESIAKAGDGRRLHLVWDDVPERGRRHAALAGGTFEPSLEKALADAATDGFVIASENAPKHALLTRALATGKPVLCEKPVALTVAQADEVAALIARHGTTMVNGYVYPFMGCYQAVMRLVANRAFGQVTHVSYRNAHGGAWLRWFDDAALAWFHDPAKAGGGGLLDEGTHGLHILRWLFGPVKRVWATHRNLSRQYPSADDFGVIHLDFASGVFGTVEGSWVQTGGPKGLQICGSDAALSADKAQEYRVHRGGAIVPLQSAEARPSEIDRLVAAIRGTLDRDEQRADLTAALDAARIMAAALASARDGRWVELAPVAAVATAQR